MLQMSILVCHQSTLDCLSQSTGRSMVPVCMFYSFIPFPLCQQVCALRCFSARYAEGEGAFSVICFTRASAISFCYSIFLPMQDKRQLAFLESQQLPEKSFFTFPEDDFMFQQFTDFEDLLIHF